NFPTTATEGEDYGCEFIVKGFLRGLAGGSDAEDKAPEHLRKDFDPEERQKRQIHEIDRHNQLVLRDCADVRREYFKKLDTTSLDTFKKTIEQYREHFAEEVIGKFDRPLLPFNARSRKTHDTAKWTGHEVVLHVF